MTKITRKITIKPPAGIKKQTTRKVGAGKKKAVKRTGGFIPMAIAAPLLAAAGIPIATELGKQGVNAGKYLVKKARNFLGIGVIRSGNSRVQGGKATAKKKFIVVRV